MTVTIVAASLLIVVAVMLGIRLIWRESEV